MYISAILDFVDDDFLLFILYSRICAVIILARAEHEENM